MPFIMCLQLCKPQRQIILNTLMIRSVKDFSETESVVTLSDGCEISVDHSASEIFTRITVADQMFRN